MATLLEQYSKAMRVVDSCTTPVQLKGAKRYINLFFRQNSKKNKFSNTWTPDSKQVGKMYEKLEMKLWYMSKKLKAWQLD